MGRRHQPFLPYEFVSARDSDGHGTHTATTAAATTTSRPRSPASGSATPAAWRPRPDRRLQGLLGQRRAEAGAHLDMRAGHRGRGRRRRRRHQLLDLRRRTSSSTRSRSRSSTRPQAGVFVVRLGRQPARARARSRTTRPWLTTVAASTHDRGYSKTVTLGNGATYTGVGLGGAVRAPIALADRRRPGRAATRPSVRLCFVGLARPGQGRRQDRRLRARRQRPGRQEPGGEGGGGVGMVLSNTTPELAQRRLPRRADRPRRQRRRRGDQGVHRGPASPTATLSRQRPAARRGAADGGLLLPRPGPRRRRRPAQARHHGARRRRRRGRPPATTRPRLRTSCPARRCPARTSPASPRC